MQVKINDNLLITPHMLAQVEYDPKDGTTGILYAGQEEPSWHDDPDRSIFDAVVALTVGPTAGSVAIRSFQVADEG